jgi:outer membrane protein insertion porin family
MKERILVRILLVLFLSFALAEGKAHGQEAMKVGILPFQVYAPDRGKAGDWSVRVVGALSSEMKKDEQIVLVEENKILKALEETGRAEVDEPLAREIGQKVDADFVVLGSITQVNGTVSLDIRILDVHEKGAPTSTFKAGRAPADLESMARQLSREVNLKILKKETVAKVLIEGHRAIEEGAIRAQIKIKEGDIYSPSAIREDLKTLYQMGYFQDVKVEKRDWERGRAVVFVVDEKPIIKEIKFSGNKNLKTRDLLDVIDLKPRSVLNLTAVQENVNKIKKKYRDEAYFAAEVQFILETPRKGEVIVHYKIQENQKVPLKRITFSGNLHYSDETLKKQLPETKESGLFSWYTKGGVYKEDILERDLDAIIAFYFLKGFLEAKVGKPRVTVEKGGITLIIPMEEGRQFKIGRVEIQGDLIAPKEELMKLVPLYPGEIFNRENVRQSISNLTDRYADKGYAFVDVNPQTIPHRDQALVDLVLDIRQGNKVYFERVNILGNTKTRDRVIRRDLQTVEGELYSLSAVKKSRDRLNYLGYFKEVNFNTKKGSADDKMVVNLQVEEAPTGSVSGGVGYSSIDKLVTIFSLSQNNLFGRGQRAVAQVQLGSISRYYSLSFTEPRLFDSEVLVGGDLFNTYRDYDDYSVKRIGGLTRFGMPLFEEVRDYFQYRYENVNVYNVRPGAADIIVQQSGLSTTSSIYGALRRDTRDNRFDPAKGFDSSVSIEYAGGPLGGTNWFTRYAANQSAYFTPFSQITWGIRSRIGYIQGNEGHPIPLYERFRLGGINTLRGFKAYSVGPKAPSGEVIGGDKELLFNFEMIFPIAKEIKLKGLLFFDAGNAWDVAQPYSLSDLRTSVGAGFRWFSPMGPLRIEWGYNLKPLPGEAKSSWDFTVGTVY